MFFKAIIQGRLEFGTQKSYDTVLKMFRYRTENYHKSDIIFEEEEIFQEKTLTLEIPRYVNQVTEKSYKNTANILDYCSQFAVAGTIRAWLIDNGRIMHHEFIEPVSDKAVVQSFIKGRKLVRQTGKEQEAIAALTKAIEKYNRHAQAYERRAKVNFIMKNYHDAIRDYTKCIKIDPSIPSAYYGRAKVYALEEKWEEAIADFDEVIKKSVALQPVYWKARRLKAICHIERKEYTKAAFDLKLFTKRNFDKENPNIFWRRWAFFHYGITLFNLEQHEEAMEAFEKALEMDDVADGIEEASMLRYRGIAKQKAGKNGFIKDIKDAAKLGDKQAKTLLEEFA